MEGSTISPDNSQESLSPLSAY